MKTKSKIEQAEEYSLQKETRPMMETACRGFIAGWDACEKSPLNPGAYNLPPDCKAFVRDGKVIVSIKKRTCVQCDRCRDCKHFGFGFATAGGWDKATVCKARPKQVKYYRTERTRQEGIYYATLATNRACEKFERKNPEP